MNCFEVAKLGTNWQNSRCLKCVKRVSSDLYAKLFDDTLTSPNTTRLVGLHDLESFTNISPRECFLIRVYQWCYTFTVYCESVVCLFCHFFIAWLLFNVEIYEMWS